MDPYNGRLCIRSDETGARLSLAQELLETGRGSVVLDGRLILEPAGNEICAAVLAKSSIQDFAAQVELAKVLLAGSTLALAGPKQKLRWEVVDETGSVLLWRAS